MNTQARLGLILIISLPLLFTIGCTSTSKLTATPTIQVNHGTPIVKPALTIIPHFWTDDDFGCWTAPAVYPNRKDALILGHLLVATGNSDNDLTLYQYDFTTGQYVRLLEGALRPGLNRPLPISPDGQKFWYGVRERAPLDSQPSFTDTIHIYNLLDGSIHQIPFRIEGKGQLMADRDAIDWSPDSQCLIFWRGDAATAYRLADGAMQSKAFPGVDFQANVSQSSTGQQWIWKMDQGVGFMRLEPNAPSSIALGKLRVDDTLYYLAGPLRWSKDGRTLAVEYSTEEVSYGGSNHIRLFRFVNGEVDSYKDIPTRAMNLQWSSNDNSLLIFLGKIAYLLYDQRTDTLTSLSSQYGHSYRIMPVWSPSSDQIAFVAEDERSLYVVNADGTGEKLLPPPPSDNSISFIIWVP